MLLLCFLLFVLVGSVKYLTFCSFFIEAHVIWHDFPFPSPFTHVQCTRHKKYKVFKKVKLPWICLIMSLCISSSFIMARSLSRIKRDKKLFFYFGSSPFLCAAVKDVEMQQYNLQCNLLFSEGEVERKKEKSMFTLFSPLYVYVAVMS